MRGLKTLAVKGSKEIRNRLQSLTTSSVAADHLWCPIPPGPSQKVIQIICSDLPPHHSISPVPNSSRHPWEPSLHITQGSRKANCRASPFIPTTDSQSLPPLLCSLSFFSSRLQWISHLLLQPSFPLIPLFLRSQTQQTFLGSPPSTPA